MSRGWKVYNLIDITSKIGSGATPKGGKEEYKDEGISLIRSQNVLDYTFTDDGLAFIDEEQAEKLKNVIIEENDVLINITGDSVARVCSVPKEYIPARVNQHVAILRANPELLDWAFLKYFLLTPFQKKQLLNLASSGATRNALTKSMLENFEINLPPLEEQKAIAHILGKLDDKIELNRQMNQTLEDMAQALFQSWFVDFDPVHAKAALKHSTLEGESENQGRSPQMLRWGEESENQGRSPQMLRWGEESENQGRSPQMIRWGEESENQGRSPQMLRWGEIKRQYTQQAQTYSKALRQNLTNAERLLWHYLRNKQLDGYKFRRQQAMGNYIVDFVCLSKKIIIELDGGQHQEQQSYDSQRDIFLQQQGYKVLRFWNNDVFNNCFGVLEKIYTELVGTNSPLEGVFDFRQKTLTILFFVSNINSILPFKIVY